LFQNVFGNVIMYVIVCTRFDICLSKAMCVL
jgi:hypothetical protein